MGLFGDALETLDAHPADEPTQIARWSAAAIQAKFLANLGQPEAGAALAAEAAEKLAMLPDQKAHLMALESQCEVLSYGSDPEAILHVCAEAIRIAEDHVLE